MTLSQNQLKENLRYCDKIGTFIHRTKTTHKDVGDLAGHIHSSGYRHISVGGKEYKAHRLAWLYVHGKFPTGILDHKNRIKDANWIDNLRDTTQLVNNRNASVRKDNQFGIAGITYENRNKHSKFIVRINNHNLGSYKTLLDACATAISYRNKL